MMDWKALLIWLLGVLPLLSVAIGMQFKDMRVILVSQILANLSISLSYAMTGGLSGAWICITATIQTALLYFLGHCGRKCPKAVTAFFMACYVAISAFNFKVVYDLLPAAAALLFSLSVTQTRSSVCRVLSLFNSVVWLGYDLFTASYGACVTHGVLIVTTLGAMIRLDRRDWSTWLSLQRKKE